MSRQRPNGKRLTSSYPKLGSIATEHVVLEQPDRVKAVKESTIPEFLRDVPRWTKDG